MANEITTQFQATVKNSGFIQTVQADVSTVQKLFDQAVVGAHGTIVTVGTSEEDMPVGDVATNGFLFLKNLDSTNFVKFGPKDGGNMVDFGRLKKGEWAWFRLAAGSTPLRWVADTAPVKVQMLLLND